MRSLINRAFAFVRRLLIPKARVTVLYAARMSKADRAIYKADARASHFIGQALEVLSKETKKPLVKQ